MMPQNDERLPAEDIKNSPETLYPAVSRVLLAPGASAATSAPVHSAYVIRKRLALLLSEIPHWMQDEVLETEILYRVGQVLKEVFSLQAVEHIPVQGFDEQANGEQCTVLKWSGSGFSALPFASAMLHADGGQCLVLPLSVPESVTSLSGFIPYSHSGLKSLHVSSSSTTATHINTSHFGWLKLGTRTRGDHWLETDLALLESTVFQLVSLLSVYQISQKFRDLRQEYQNKSEFLASLAHELRTPLHTIIASAAMGTEGLLGELDEKQTHYMALIGQSGDHLLQMINELLDLAKMDAGKYRLRPQYFNLRSFLTELTGSIQPLMMSSEQTFATKFSDTLPELVYGDPLRLKQVCLNLLSNAHKYTPNGGSIDFVCRVEPAENDIILTIAVSDTGIGICPSQCKRIFEPYEQAEIHPVTKRPRLDEENTNRFSGTGLGLTIARRIVHLHGGSIGVESTPGEGSTFTVKLPLYTP